MRPHRHEQRDQPALAHAADHLAPVVEHAGDAVLGQAVEIVERGALAFRREQLDERPARHLVILVAEQRLGRAVEREHGPSRSTTITPSVAVSRIECSSRASASAARSAISEVAQPVGRGGAHQHQHQRALAVPRHGVEPALAGQRVAGAGRDREGLAGAVDAVERAGVGIDHEPLEPARGGDRREVAHSRSIRGRRGWRRSALVRGGSARRPAGARGWRAGRPRRLPPHPTRRPRSRTRSASARRNFLRARLRGCLRSGFGRGGAEGSGAIGGASPLPSVSAISWNAERSTGVSAGRFSAGAARAERHDVLGGRHHGEQRTRLAVLRRQACVLGRRLGRRGRCARRRCGAARATSRHTPKPR